MTDDIVFALRNGIPCAPHKCRTRKAESGCMCAQGADEIESLREQLRLAQEQLELEKIATDGLHFGCADLYC